VRAYPLALALALSPFHLAAQTATVDLTGQPLETVIPAEFAGGFFARIAGMVVDDRGIWVVDRGHLTVFGFGPGGSLTAQYGREGEGPGEFLFPSSLKVDSVLTVTDPRLGRTVRFRLDGEHLETTTQEGRPVTPYGMEVPFGNVASLPDGYLIGATVGYYSFGQSSDGSPLHGDPFSHILLFHPDGLQVDTLASYHINAGRWDAPERLGGNIDPGLGMSGAWAFVGDSMAVLADGIAGTLTRVRIGDAAPLADTFDLGMRARPVSDRDMADIEARLREEKPDLPRRLEFEMAEGWSVATAVSRARTESSGCARRWRAKGRSGLSYDLARPGSGALCYRNGSGSAPSMGATSTASRGTRSTLRAWPGSLILRGRLARVRRRGWNT